MGEEFSGLGSSFYIGLPGQPFENTHEVKLQYASEAIKAECIDETKERIAPRGYPISLNLEAEPSCGASALLRFMQQGQRCYNELDHIIAETTALMASWLCGSRCIARYNRLRRHYNRWRRSYTTRKTFYATPFNKFLHGFMVHYVAMRNYHQENLNNQTTNPLND